MRLPKNPTLLEIRAQIRSAKFRMKELDKAIDALEAFERIQASERMTPAYPAQTPFDSNELSQNDNVTRFHKFTQTGWRPVPGL